VLAGGVMTDSDLFLDTALEVLKTSPLHEPDRLLLRTATLGELSGAYGAAKAAMTSDQALA